MPNPVKYSLTGIRHDIDLHRDPVRAESLQRFFKTAPGQYGQGDIFLGLTVPQARLVATKYKNLPLTEVVSLLRSPIHEYRLIALVILTEQFKSGNQNVKKTIFDLYLANTKYINNWDLVDLSAHKIVGSYLINQDTTILTQLAKSDLLWDRRIAIISTFAFIKRGEYAKIFKIAKILLNDKHDLIHKAVGWVLREVGKSSGQAIEESFLKKHYSQMPRTMLRYAIERFPKTLRQQYLLGQI